MFTDYFERKATKVTKNFVSIVSFCSILPSVFIPHPCSFNNRPRPRNRSGTGAIVCFLHCSLISHHLSLPTPYGTVFTDGSLHGPSPAAPRPRTRNHMRAPETNPVNNASERVEVV